MVHDTIDEIGTNGRVSRSWHSLSDIFIGKLRRLSKTVYVQKFSYKFIRSKTTDESIKKPPTRSI